MSLSSPARVLFVVWLVEAKHVLTRSPWVIVLGASTGFLIAYFPLSSMTLAWPIVYTLVIAWLCRRLLPRLRESPARMPWIRLLLLGATAGLPMIVINLPLGLLGASAGTGPLLLLHLLASANAALGQAAFFILMDLLAAMWLLCIVVIAWAPACVAVAGHGVGRALATSVRAWCMNPLAACMTFLAALLLWVGDHLVFALLVQVDFLVGRLGEIAYGVVCAIAAASFSVAASATVLARMEVAEWDSGLRPGSE